MGAYEGLLDQDSANAAALENEKFNGCLCTPRRLIYLFFWLVFITIAAVALWKALEAWTTNGVQDDRIANINSNLNSRISSVNSSLFNLINTAANINVTINIMDELALLNLTLVDEMMARAAKDMTLMGNVTDLLNLLTMEIASRVGNDTITFQSIVLVNQSVTDETLARIDKDMLLMNNITTLFHLLNATGQMADNVTQYVFNQLVLLNQSIVNETTARIDKDMILMNNVTTLFNLLNVTGQMADNVTQYVLNQLVLLNQSIVDETTARINKDMILMSNVTTLFTLFNVTSTNLALVNQSIVDEATARINKDMILMGNITNLLSLINAIPPPLTGGIGISVTGGVINLANVSGVSGTYSNPNMTIDNQGRIVSIVSGSVAAAMSGNNGTVTSVDTGAGLTGGPITSSGIISLQPLYGSSTTVTYPTSITYDTFGRIAALTNTKDIFIANIQAQTLSGIFLPAYVTFTPYQTGGIFASQTSPNLFITIPQAGYYYISYKLYQAQLGGSNFPLYAVRDVPFITYSLFSFCQNTDGVNYCQSQGTGIVYFGAPTYIALGLILNSAAVVNIYIMESPIFNHFTIMKI
ncbi:MAG: hypothetical protein K2Q45_09080 [Nitrosomonas sp.]|nr:hypothetical protein [Nitrosomonas sp.]